MKHVKEKHKPNKQNCPSQRKTEVCELCGYVSRPGNMKIHVARMHEKASIRPTSCTYCGKEFPQYMNMARHRKIAHREQWNIDRERLMIQEGSIANASELPKKTKEWKKYVQKSPCTICGRVLCSRTQLHMHMKALHGTGLPGYREGMYKGNSQ